MLPSLVRRSEYGSINRRDPSYVRSTHNRFAAANLMISNGAGRPHVITVAGGRHEVSIFPPTGYTGTTGLAAAPNNQSKTLVSSAKKSAKAGSCGSWCVSILLHSASSSLLSGRDRNAANVGTGNPLKAHFSFNVLTTNARSHGISSCRKKWTTS